MRLHSDTLAAFSDELAKIAAAATAPRGLPRLQSKLEPGDILVGGRRDPSVLGRALSVFQGGTKNYHAALYVGDGQVVDIHPETGVTRKPLEDFGAEYRFKALRVKAPDAARKDAVQYAKSQVGKEYDYLGVARQALPVWNEKHENKRQDVDRFFCSQLVANAYPSVPFAKNRFVGNTRPVDLQRSSMTKTVGSVR